MFWLQKRRKCEFETGEPVFIPWPNELTMSTFISQSREREIWTAETKQNETWGVLNPHETHRLD